MAKNPRRTPEDELLDRAKHGDVDGVRAALRKGARPDGPAGASETPLIATLRRPRETQVAIVDALLAAGADPNLATGGTTPLVLALSTHFVPDAIVDALLASGADVEQAEVGGRTPLEAAIEAFDPGRVARILAMGANPDRPTSRGISPLALGRRLHVFPVETAMARIDATLLVAGASESADARLGARESALLEALRALVPCVRVRRPPGMRPRPRPDKRAEHHRTAPGTVLALALEPDPVEHARALFAALVAAHGGPSAGAAPVADARASLARALAILAEGPVDLPRVEAWLGRPAIELAADLGEAPLAWALLDGGADPNALAPDGATALHRAASLEGPDVARVLVASGARVDVDAPALGTPLFEAARFGRLATVQLLLEAGADAVAARADGRTAADVAAGDSASAIRTSLRTAHASKVLASKGRALRVVAGKQGVEPDPALASTYVELHADDAASPLLAVRADPAAVLESIAAMRTPAHVVRAATRRAVPEAADALFVLALRGSPWTLVVSASEKEGVALERLATLARTLPAGASSALVAPAKGTTLRYDPATRRPTDALAPEDFEALALFVPILVPHVDGYRAWVSVHGLRERAIASLDYVVLEP